MSLGQNEFILAITIMGGIIATAIAILILILIIKILIEGINFLRISYKKIELELYDDKYKNLQIKKEIEIEKRKNNEKNP